MGINLKLAFADFQFRMSWMVFFFPDFICIFLWYFRRNGNKKKEQKKEEKCRKKFASFALSCITFNRQFKG